MARPSKYNEKFISEADVYLAECVDATVDGRLKVNIPTIEGFALHIGVNKDTLYGWSKDNATFSDALTKIKTEQQQRLLNNGLAGTYNSTIAKLVLSSNHNMREKSDVTTNDKDLPTPILNVLPNDSNKQDTETE
jgi:hypothetical protein